MIYKLKFLPQAEKEWKKLDGFIKNIFKKKLKKILQNPHIKANALTNMPDCYKIKLRESGYRLVYQVEDEFITIFVISIGKRDKKKVYAKAIERLY